ncbi:MAG TPA: phosphopantetheine-binding protein [Opitutales bacterium]|nr:phosphopantetheine-binding protein [Opitutales bacterium]
MTRAEKLERLQEIFRDVLDQPALRLSEEFSTSDCPEWDSVATVQIVLATEADFGIRVPMDTVAHLRRVGELLDLLP